MAACDNPKFIEDLIRDLTLTCRERGFPHRIEARNMRAFIATDTVARLWDGIDLEV